MSRIDLREKVLNENDRIAGELRERFARKNALVLNFISSPGAGKTALLEQTLRWFPKKLKAATLTGDIETENDAERIAPYGFPVKQITTGGACHLDARMVERGLDELGADEYDVLFIENIGNLVCPSSFDLGEEAKIVLLSVTEGDDKPFKYPSTFVRADLLIINKIDLAPYVDFDMMKARKAARKVNPNIEILELSCKTGDGIKEWVHWIQKKVHLKRKAIAS